MFALVLYEGNVQLWADLLACRLQQRRGVSASHPRTMGFGPTAKFPNSNYPLWMLWFFLTRFELTFLRFFDNVPPEQFLDISDSSDWSKSALPLPVPQIPIQNSYYILSSTAKSSYVRRNRLRYGFIPIQLYVIYRCNHRRRAWPRLCTH